MPITVKHGGENLGALAALALIAGAGQQKAPQAPQMADLLGALPRAGGGGGGGGGRVRRSSGSLFQLGRGEMSRGAEMREAQRLEMERMQEEARIEASQWKTEFTFKQRQEIAKFNNARQMITQNSRFSPYERQEALRLIDLQQAGIQPSKMPRNPNEPQFEEGKEPGRLWEHEGTGAIMRTVIKDGVPTPEIVLRPDQTMQHEQMKLKAAQATAEASSRAALEKEMRAARFKLATEEVPIWGKDDKGATIEKGKRRRTSGETNAAMWEIYGGVRQQLDPGQQQQPPLEIEPEGIRQQLESLKARGQQQEQLSQQEQLPAAAPSPMEGAMAEGMEITEKDKKFPPNVGAAHAYIRHVTKRGRGDIEKMSPEEREAFRQAIETIRDYNRTRKYARGGK